MSPGKYLPAALLLSLVPAMTSCRKEPATPTWDVDVAVPLLRTTLGLGDLLPDSILSTDADGDVSLLYTTRLFALKLDTLLSAPDTTLRYVYPPFDLGGASLTFFPGTTIPAITDVTRFDLEDLSLSELHVRSGELELELTSRLATDIAADFRIDGSWLNGAPLEVTGSIPPGSAALPSTLVVQQPLDGMRFDLRGPQFDDVNTISPRMDLTTDPAGPSVQMTAADSLEARVSYRNVVPAYARGYFGTRQVELDPDTSELEVFRDISGLLDLHAAEARLRVRNGVGMDMQARLLHLHGINTSTGAVVQLQHPIVGGPLNVDRAIDLGGSFQEATNGWTVNSANSNLAELIEVLPDRLAYDLDLVLDPLGDVSNGNDFFYYESRLSADLEVEMPLLLRATDLRLRKEFAVDLEGTLEQHALQRGTLHLFVTNGFPFSAGLQLAIVAADGTVQAELPPGGTVPSAAINAGGEVTSGAFAAIGFTIEAHQLDLLYPDPAVGRPASRLRVTATFNTAGTGQVQLRAEHAMDLQVSFEGRYLVNGNE